MHLNEADAEMVELAGWDDVEGARELGGVVICELLEYIGFIELAIKYRVVLERGR